MLFGCSLPVSWHSRGFQTKSAFESSEFCSFVKPAAGPKRVNALIWWDSTGDAEGKGRRFKHKVHFRTFFRTFPCIYQKTLAKLLFRGMNLSQKLLSRRLEGWRVFTSAFYLCYDWHRNVVLDSQHSSFGWHIRCVVYISDDISASRTS